MLKRVADLATIAMAISAVIIVGLLLTDHAERSEQSIAADEELSGSEWRQFAESDRRIGSADATVTIVEFGDYQCPFCREAETQVRQVLARYPSQVALVYRHYPLSYHEHAYRAARYAECAGAQDRFPQAHRLLYDTDDLGQLDATAFATAINVDDSDAFVTCARNSDPVPSIEEDRRAAETLNVRSTPTFVVGGLRLARIPRGDSLLALVEMKLEAAPRAGISAGRVREASGSE